MSIEALVTFIVFLFLSVVALAIRWVNDRIRRDIALRDLKDLFLPSDGSPEEPGKETPEALKTSQVNAEPPILTSSTGNSPVARQSGSRLRLHNRVDLRQGIIIMTILGPCRALERPDD